jgi:hypothetical protein
LESGARKCNVAEPVPLTATTWRGADGLVPTVEADASEEINRVNPIAAKALSMTTRRRDVLPLDSPRRVGILLKVFVHVLRVVVEIDASFIGRSLRKRCSGEWIVDEE